MHVESSLYIFVIDSSSKSMEMMPFLELHPNLGYCRPQDVLLIDSSDMVNALLEIS